MTAPPDAAGFLAAATERTGLHDFGDRAFVEPLERLVASVRTEGRLDEFTSAAFEADMVRLLSSRLGIQAAFTAHPEIAAEDVSDPVVVTGMPRTGTTKLHKVLAAGGGFQQMLFWQGLFPTPPAQPDAPAAAPPSAAPDPRIALAEGQVQELLRRVPDLAAAHPTRTEEAEEDGLLLQLSFRTLHSGWVCHAPSYLAWVIGQDQAPAYADLHRGLQYLQWQGGGRRGRPWVLKAPIHLGAIDVVLETFPDATVVHCHRDLLEAVPSAARLYEVVHRSYGIDPDPVAMGQIALLIAHAWARNIAVREGLNPAQVLDVDYADIREDIGAVVDAVHAARGIALDEASRAAMVGWEDANPQHGEGRHRYTLERFGLTPAAIEAAYAGYLAHFGDRARRGRAAADG